MKGADEYCKLFKEAEQIGRLYLLPGSHARGKTFRIYVLPEEEKAIPNGHINPPSNKNAVEVYGIISGNPGWTESYGWKHEGKWIQDFNEIVEQRREKLDALDFQAQQEHCRRDETEKA